MGKIKKFFTDFKTFITKGNILDMAVGVVVGTSFSAIVTALVKQVLMPLVTAAVPGGLTGFVTVLNPAEASLTAAQAAALVAAGGTTIEYWGVTYNASIVNVMNWGEVINALINFIIIAFILFCIVRSVLIFNQKSDALKARSKAFTPEERKALRKEGKSYREINKLADEKVASEAKEKAEKDAVAKANQVNEITLLTDIKKLLSDKDSSKEK